MRRSKIGYWASGLVLSAMVGCGTGVDETTTTTTDQGTVIEPAPVIEPTPSTTESTTIVEPAVPVTGLNKTETTTTEPVIVNEAPPGGFEFARD